MKTFKQFVESIDPTVADRKHGFSPLKLSKYSKEECKYFEREEGKTICMHCGKKKEEHKVDPTVMDRQ